MDKVDKREAEKLRNIVYARRSREKEKGEHKEEERGIENRRTENEKRKDKKR